MPRLRINSRACLAIDKEELIARVFQGSEKLAFGFPQANFWVSF